MRILVTGGAGYIGAVLVPALLEQGHAVTVLDTFMYAQASLLDVCHRQELTVVRGDAGDGELLARLLPGCEAIVPLACLTGAPLCAERPDEARAVIVGAIATLLQRRDPRQRIIYPTTNSGYGIGERDVHCTEASPLRPVSLYGRLKAEAEQRILDAGNAVTLRLATAFGASPRLRLDLLVNDFTYRAVRDRALVLFESHYRRNFIHVRDIARAFLHVLEHPAAIADGIYNVGLDDANLSKRELAERIRRQVPELQIVEAPSGSDPDQRDYTVSSEKFSRTGFAPVYSLDAGITELLRAFQIVRNERYGNA